jgi:hypothetical protein
VRYSYLRLPMLTQVRRPAACNACVTSATRFFFLFNDACTRSNQTFEKRAFRFKRRHLTQEYVFLSASMMELLYLGGGTLEFKPNKELTHLSTVRDRTKITTANRKTGSQKSTCDVIAGRSCSHGGRKLLSAVIDLCRKPE